MVKNQLKDASDFNLDVKKITVNGNDATATVQSQFNGDDTLRTLTLVKDANAWRIASMGT